MMSFKSSKSFLWLLSVVLVFAACLVLTIRKIDRTSYRELPIYDSMIQRIDSLGNSLPQYLRTDSLRVGWSKTSITPDRLLPLAGYGARDPKLMIGTHDSSFIRSIVLDNKINRLAIISTDLLINHPEYTSRLNAQLATIGWKEEEIFLMATHTHSGLGGWAPGMVGELFAGEYQQEITDWLVRLTVESIENADDNKESGQIGYGEMALEDLVKNRLVGDKGIVDPWLKVLFLEKQNQTAVLGTSAIHATCLGSNFRELSSDYPGAFCSRIESFPELDFAAFGAGAVGSMSTALKGPKIWSKAESLGNQLAEQVELLQTLGIPKKSEIGIRSYRVPLALRDPGLKILENYELRSWIFKNLFGDYQSFISVVQLGDILYIGTPCDFSGELAIPLYEQARLKGLNLVITSFNGGYIGYVPEDKWYDLNKYETRTMSWYGHDNGAYLSEIISKLIDISAL